MVLAGGGNNGGDALVVAALLDMPVTVYATRPLTELRGEARQAARDLPDHVHVEERTELDDSDFRPGDLIVDGLLGTGFAGELRPQFRNYIEVANRSGQPVVAMDLPSGINGDTGVARFRRGGRSGADGHFRLSEAGTFPRGWAALFRTAPAGRHRPECR